MTPVGLYVLSTACAAHGEIRGAVVLWFEARTARCRYGVWSRAKPSLARQRKEVAPHIPVIDAAKRKDGIVSREDFTYDKARDVYTCPGGKLSGWPAETSSGSTSQPIRPRTGSRARSPKHSLGLRRRDPRSGLHLWRCRHAPIAHHGDPRQAHRPRSERHSSDRASKARLNVLGRRRPAPSLNS